MKTFLGVVVLILEIKKSDICFYLVRKSGRRKFAFYVQDKI